MRADTNSETLSKRDFSATPSPIGDIAFSFDKFSELLNDKNQNIKTALVGKSAVVVGLSNAAFQEIIFEAGIHPKRNTSTLSKNEKHRLFNAIRKTLTKRISSGGKENWINLYG